MTLEDFFETFFDAEGVRISDDQEIVYVTFRAVSRGNLKEFYVAEISTNQSYEEIFAAILAAIKEKEEHQESSWEERL